MNKPQIRQAPYPAHMPKEPPMPKGEPQPQAPKAEVAAEPQAAPKKEANRIIILDYPVTFAGETHTQLTVRRMKAKDFRQLDQLTQGGHSAAIAMSALICNVDEAIIDELDALDYLKVQEVVAEFFPSDLVAKLQAKASR